MEMKKMTLFLAAVLAAWAPARADDLIAPAVRWDRTSTSRPFLTVSVLRNTLEGDLDGLLALGTTEKVFYIPKLDPGLGLSVGYGRSRKNGLWMVNFTRSFHNASFRGTDSSASYNAIEFGGRGYLWTRAPVLPYLQAGFGMSLLHVRDAAERGGTIYDANYVGLSVNGGAGVHVPLGPRMFLTGGATYRFFAGMYAKGPGRGRDVTNLYIDRTGPRRHIFLKVPGLRLEAGVGYFF